MKKILIATDGSSCAEEAAWLLSHLPHNGKLEIHVLTVLQIPYGHQRYLSATALSESVDHERTAGRQAFERVADMFQGADVTLHHVTREGHRGQAIVDTAEELNVDLTVVGARGHSTVRRLLLGSTSDYVATHTRSSVLVVRPTGLRQETRPIRIAMGYEESEAAKFALRELSQTKWGRQSDVHVVSVVSYVSAFLNELIVEVDEIREAASKSVGAAADRLRQVAPRTTSHLIECDHVGEGLINFVEENSSDLIVVGETPHTALGRVVLGSVSRFALRHAPCSVWISRDSSALESKYQPALEEAVQ